MLNDRQVFFDLDGTLINSSPSIVRSLDYALKNKKITPLIPLTNEIVGPPLGDTLIRLVGVDNLGTLSEIRELFISHYDTHECYNVEAYDGVSRGLTYLLAEGFKLHLTTNKRSVPTLKILEKMAWKDKFESIWTIDKITPNFHGKKEMLRNQISYVKKSNWGKFWYVGDRYEDYEAAFANDVNFLGVVWGYGVFPEVINQVNSFSQLISELESEDGITVSNWR